MPILLFQDIKLNLNYPRPLKSSHENGKRTVAGKVRLSSAGKCPLVTGSLRNFSAPGYRSSETVFVSGTGEVATTLGILYRLLARENGPKLGTSSFGRKWLISQI